MDEIKIRNKTYHYGNFPDLEQFLSEEHAKGHRFVRYQPRLLSGDFVFEKCEPQEMVYKLDYGKIEDFDSYQTLFADCGWEYIGSRNQFHLFCKPKTGEEAEEIFSDNKSKAEMCKKVLSTRNAIMISLICAFNLSNQLFQRADVNGMVSTIASVAMVLCNISFMIFLVTMLCDIDRLNDIIQTYEYPLEQAEQKSAKKGDQTTKKKASK